MNLVDKIIRGVCIKAASIDICTEVDGSSVGLMIDEVDISPINSSLEKQYAMTRGMSTTSASPMLSTEMPTSFENFSDTVFAWSIKIMLATGHYIFDADTDSDRKKVCFLDISGLECIISVPPILGTLVFGRGPNGKCLKIPMCKASLLSIRFHPGHIRFLSVLVLKLLGGSSSFRTWFEDARKVSDLTCRSYQPTPDELKSYSQHWKLQINSNTPKPHDLDRKISVCHMIMLRARAGGWKHYCPTAVDSRALSHGIVEALDLKGGFSSHSGDEPTDQESLPMTDEEDSEGDGEVMEIETGAQLYTSDRRESAQCNALLYWLCNKWVRHVEAQGGAISELDLSIIVDKLEILVLNGGVKLRGGDGSAAADLSDDNLDDGCDFQASFIFSCYEAQLNVNMLLASVPLTPITGYYKNDHLGEYHPYLLDMCSLAVGSDGQIESEQQPAMSISLDMYGMSLIDVEELKNNVPYCSLLSTQKDHTTCVELKFFNRQNVNVAIQQVGRLLLALRLERFWAIFEAFLFGTSAFFSVPAHQSDPEEELQVTALHPSKTGAVCHFMPQLGIDLDAKLQSVSIVLIDDVKNVNSAILYFHLSLNARVHSGFMKEAWKVDATDVSLLPVIHTEQSSMETRVKNHVRSLKSAIQRIEQYAQHSEMNVNSSSPREMEEIQEMRKVIMDGLNYDEVGYMIVEKEPIIHPSAIYIRYESHFDNEQKDRHKSVDAGAFSDDKKGSGENDETISGPSLDDHATPYVYVTLGIDVVELLELSSHDALIADEYIADAYNGYQVLTATIGNNILQTGEGKIIPDSSKFGALYQEYLSFCLTRTDGLQDINISIKPAAESVEIATGKLLAKPRVKNDSGPNSKQQPPMRVKLNDRSKKICGHAIMHAHIDPAFLLVSVLKIKPSINSVVIFRVHVEDKVGTIKVDPYVKHRHRHKKKNFNSIAEGLLFDIRTKNPTICILAFIQGQEDQLVTHTINFDLSERGFCKLLLDGSTIYVSLDLVRFSPSFESDPLAEQGGDHHHVNEILTPRVGSAFEYITKATVQPPYPGGSYPGIPPKYQEHLQVKVVKEKEKNSGTSVFATLDLNIKQGLLLRITDLDVIVLQRIFANVMEGVNIVHQSLSETGTGEGEDENEEVVQVVHLLRRAFERYDVDNSGTLSELEVKGLLRRHLTNLSEQELDVQVQRFMTVAGINDMGMISLEDFTNAMLRVLNEDNDPQAIESARKRALVEAFIEADTDGTGELDRKNIMTLLRSLTPSAITSEIEVAVSNFMRLADSDGSGAVVLDEFVHLCEMLSSGVIEGRAAMMAGDFCCSSFRKSLLGFRTGTSDRRLDRFHNEKCLTLGQFLAMEDPSYRPRKMWSIIYKEMGVDGLPKASEDSISDVRFSDEFLEEAQCKLVKAFLNYMLAREIWGLVIVPDLCDSFLPRVSKIEVVDSKETCVQILAPLVVGNELYTGSSHGHMRLINLPTILKNVVVTGVRTILRDRRSRNTRYLTFKVSGPCDIHICIYKKFRGTLVLPSWLRRSGYRPTKSILEAQYEFPRRREIKKKVNFVLFSRTQKSAGTIILGGNESLLYHYVVLISPLLEMQIDEVDRCATSDVSKAGTRGIYPFDSHTLRWRLRPSSILSNSDAWYRSINSRAKQRTMSINAIVSQIGAAVIGNIMDSESKPMTLFNNIQLSTSIIVGPIKLQLIDVSRAQSLPSRMDAPLLEVCLGTLPESTPVIRICCVDGCTQMIDSEIQRHSAIIQSSQNIHSLFCDRHMIRCAVQTCDKMATHCLLSDKNPILCGDHAASSMVPFIELGMNADRLGMDFRGPEMKLFWFHPTDGSLLDYRDILTMRAIFGLRVSYFNTLTRKTEHLIEPWGVVLKAGSMTTDTFTSMVFAAPRHFGINVSTSFLSSLQVLSSMFSDSNPFLDESSLTSYGELGLYSKWSTMTLDPSKHLQVRNRLGVPIDVSLASVLGYGARQRIEHSLHDNRRKQKNRKRKTDKRMKRRGSGVSAAGHSPVQTIQNGESGELYIPNLDSVKHLMLQLTPEGFDPILDVELDFFSMKEQLFYLVRPFDSTGVKEDDKEPSLDRGLTSPITGISQELSELFPDSSSEDEEEEEEEEEMDLNANQYYVSHGRRQPLISRRKGAVAVVVKFIKEPGRDASTLDVIMEVSTNISVYNNTFSPILVNLTPESEGGSKDFCLERGGSIPLPVQVLTQELLYITEREPGVRDEPLELSPFMFDVEGTPFSRHSSEVLKNCIAIQMTDPAYAERENDIRPKKSIKTRRFAAPSVPWQLTVEPPYVIVNALPVSVRVEITQEKGFGDKPDMQEFYLESGGVVDLPILDLMNSLQARVQLGGGGQLSPPFTIEADEHLCRGKLVKVPVKELDPPGGPQISIAVQWESITMPRTITVFAEVWVLNRTGVAMRYKTPYPGNSATKQLLNSNPFFKHVLQNHNEEHAVPSNFRLLNEAYYTDDVHSALTCKGYKRVENPSVNRLEDSSTNGLTEQDQSNKMTDCLIPPTLLHCPTRCLEVLPHYMAEDVTNEDSFCLYGISCSSSLPPRSVSFSFHELKSSKPMQIYWDLPNLRLVFPEAIRYPSSSCFQIMLDYVGRLKNQNANDPVLLAEAMSNFINFVCDSDCYIYIALDADELGGRPTSPVWLRRVGFLPIDGQEEAVKPTRSFVAVKNGFYFYRRFFRGGTRVLLGRVEALLAVACKKESINGGNGSVGDNHAIADISTISMHSLTENLSTMNRYWYVVPEWSQSIPIYSDGRNCCLEAPPTSSSGRSLPPLTLIQTKQEIGSFSNMSAKLDRELYTQASFVALQDSTILLCYDSCAESVPAWVSSGGWEKRMDNQPPLHATTTDGKTAQFSFNIFTKDICKGSIVKLGRRWPKGKPYFLFVYVKVVDVTFHEDVTTVTDLRPQICADAFWNKEANGPLVQTPLELNWRGRSWSSPFSTQMLRNVDTVSTESGVFGVTVNVLPGIFHVTREVSLYPPVVIRNELDYPILVLPCLEAPFEGSNSPKKQLNAFKRRIQKRKKKLKRRKQVENRQKDKSKFGRESLLPQNVYTDTDGKPVFISSRSYVQYLAPGECAAVYDFSDISRTDSLFIPEGGEYGIVERQRCIRLVSTWPSWESDTLSCCYDSSYQNESCDSDSILTDVNMLGGSHHNKEVGGEEKENNNNNDSHSHLNESVRTSSKSLFQPSVEDTTEQEVSLPIFYEKRIGESSHLWLKHGVYDKLLVKASCQLQPNQATVLVRLSDVSKQPPMRIENLSSYRTLVYRIGCSHNTFSLGPMRWRVFVWGDDSRTIHVGVEGDEDRGRVGALLRSSFRSGVSSQSIRPYSAANNDLNVDVKDTTNVRECELTRKKAGLQFELDDLFHSQPKDNLKPYTLEGVGTQPKLIPSDGERPLLVECVRRIDTLATLALTFKDAQEKSRLYRPQPNIFHAEEEESDTSDDEDDDASAQEETIQRSKKSFLEIVVKAAYFSAFRVSIAGCIFTLVHSTRAGPKERIAITFDDIKLEKGQFSDHIQFSLWHVQVDDLEPTAVYPIIMQPIDSGFNSHREPTLTARPFCTIESERDLETLVTHHIQSFHLLRLGIKPFKCLIYVDGFVDIAFVFLDALSWAVPGEDQRRELTTSRVLEGLDKKLTLMPTVAENIYLRRFEAELPRMHVRFQLGRKVTGLIGTKLLSGEDDEFPDDEGFLSSPLMGGAVVEVLKSLGDTFANASPVFSFPTIVTSNYYGTSSNFFSMLLLRVTTQTVKQSYNIVGSIDLLGDPLTLCRRYAGGISGFVGMTSKGRPAQGAKELVKGFIGGTAGSISKMAGAVDLFLSGLQTTDIESEELIRILHLKDIKAAHDKRRHFGHGVKSGAKYFARSMVRGLTGVVTQPIHGVQTRGSVGLVLGIGKGITGVVVAPVSGTFGATKYLIGGIDDTTLLLDDPLMGRRRPSRDGNESLVLEPIRINDLDASIPNAYHNLKDDEGRYVNSLHIVSRIDADRADKVQSQEKKRKKHSGGGGGDDGSDDDDLSNLEFKKGKKKSKLKRVKRAFTFGRRRHSSDSRQVHKEKKKSKSSFRRRSIAS